MTISYDPSLTMQLKKKAYELGADLVGFANIERFENAPPMMSPQGILPTARTVMVCAIHHPDATIELDGEASAHICDSYGVQIAMNDKLDHISFTLACFLEDMGYRSVPIVSSNIWRYKEYKDLKAVFAPDISHIYAAVTAGLTELGWNGLSLSPEYGPRNRFVSIITDAAIEPTPLYKGKALCDMCGACIRHCPTEAFTKEVNGVNNVKVEDKDNRFANKNLWRCAWSEHFALDLDQGVPDVVTEEVILNTVEKQGRRSGTLGTCLKVCIPPDLRTEKPDYTSFTTRKNQFMPTGLPLPRKVIDQAILTASDYAADRVVVLSKETAEAKGIDLSSLLPDARGVMVVGLKWRLDGYAGIDEKDRQQAIGSIREEAQRAMVFATLDMARIFDTLGISVISQSRKMQDIIRKTDLFGPLPEDCGISYSSVVVNCDLPDLDIVLRGSYNRKLAGAQAVKALALSSGANLVGISSTDRIDSVVDQLSGYAADQMILDAEDMNDLFTTYDPKVTPRKLRLCKPQDYLPEGKSVLVLGLRYPEAALERAGKPPAEAVGPYVFVQYQVHRELTMMAIKVIKALQDNGYKAVLTHDLTRLGTETGSPRGLHTAPINNAVEAVCAGLGQLTWNRSVYTEAYGINQGFIAIVTDMPLTADPVEKANIQVTCADCRQCVAACPVAALIPEEQLSIQIGQEMYDFMALDTNRCRWATRYALTNRDGFAHNGSTLDLQPPAALNEETLAEGLRKRDPINKFRPTIVQSCRVVCPLQKKQGL
jgi:epoxyqueuosine reductase QueG